ncbi:MAG: molecular chaperone GrpE [Pseudomonadota bacterium]|nr:molecular chaperone GrpE [Pseudomonadota bacterium]
MSNQHNSDNNKWNYKSSNQTQANRSTISEDSEVFPQTNIDKNNDAKEDSVETGTVETGAAETSEALAEGSWSDQTNVNNNQGSELGNNLENKIKLLQQELAECKDTYVRSQAEIQNVYKRNQDELKKTRDYAISSFAKDLVQVKDYLEMALKDESGNFEMLKMGVDLTLKQLVQVFDTHKIKEIAPKALAKLDPHLHQAMNTVKVEGQESNTVVAVMQKGYSLNDRVLRPAMVTVAE